MVWFFLNNSNIVELVFEITNMVLVFEILILSNGVLYLERKNTKKYNVSFKHIFRRRHNYTIQYLLKQMFFRKHSKKQTTDDITLLLNINQNISTQFPNNFIFLCLEFYYESESLSS